MPDEQTYQSRALLPTGMMDEMPNDAERGAAATQKLQTIFAQFGYRLVNPPLLEFEETLLAEGAGQALSTNTFRLMDPVSQRMMALRSDTTAQIARISASRLKTAPRPLRLAYIADVLRIQSTQLRPERQFKQAGCEFIGAGKNAATEIALLALVSLHESGVRDISIDFTAPEILKTLLNGNPKKDDILKACQRRDRAAFEQLGALGKTLIALDEISGPARDFAAKKKNVKISKPILQILDQLEAVIKDLQKVMTVYGLEKNVSITIDPLEMRGYEYQSFPCFTLFAKNIRGELGRGGAYISHFNGMEEKACGFTLYMDSVLRALPASGGRKSVLVPEKCTWADIKTLQSKGWNVVKSTGTADAGKAASFDATHILKNGKTEEI